MVERLGNHIIDPKLVRLWELIIRAQVVSSRGEFPDVFSVAKGVCFIAKASSKRSVSERPARTLVET